VRLVGTTEGEGAVEPPATASPGPKHLRRRPGAARAYVWSVVILAAAALTLWAPLVGFSLYPPVLVVGLGLGLVCATERLWPVSLGAGRATFEFGGAPILGALVLGGPACALLAAIPSAAYRDPRRAAFQGGIHVLQILTGALAFAVFCPEPLLLGPEPGFSAPFVLGTLSAGAVFFSLDVLIGPGLMRLKYGLSGREVLDEIVVPALPSDALAVAGAMGAALGVASFGTALAAPGLLLGAALSVAAASSVRENRKKALRLASENAALRDALTGSGIELASRLVAASGLRDGYSAAHAAASSVYAGDIAEELGLGKERAEELRLTALLMDVGLLFVPDEVLITPPEKLNSLGRARLEEHPKRGEEILSAVPGLPPEAARWARWHHERADGTGYPDRLKAAWTPLEAKVLAAASLYSSMVLDGPTASGLPPGKARRVLIGEIGKAVDGAVVSALLRVLDSEDAAYASAADGRFSFRQVDGLAEPTLPVAPEPPRQRL